ncbi:alkaline phosphatase family protein [Alteromonas sp. a30]|uniref:alkaline phosphatase family protein n=1 Tax=Alteromonas sp. a30 TaxID=2730917 RepID=UPI0022828BA1|nr:nucleotide pyrophosphatase/phosphodiesterase family protein [Alteromonas sp. a30]MCY7297258.1 alkaline phosphatase family protein [Alteromonas sp. a30]
MNQIASQLDPVAPLPAPSIRSAVTTTKSLAVVNVVGLTPELLGQHTPNINALANKGEMLPMEGVFPAVTTTAQATMVTGKMPNEHGIVGNGWYFKDLAEVKFWLQPNSIVQGNKVWDDLKARNPEFSCSKLFWWYNMYANVDNAITPRPHYPADGRKIMGLYSEPAMLHENIESDIGTFPFFNFWGPNADIRSSRWIVDCAIAEFQLNRPNLQLVYLPHLDYNLQRLGPSHPDVTEDIKQIDTEVGRLLDFYQAHDVDVVLVSEYGIEPVKQSVSLNRILRQAGYLRVRESVSWELLDCGASRAFAVADHQIAHVYVQNSSDVAKVKALLQKQPGVEQVLDKSEQAAWHINHERSGELVVIAEPECWFDYYYWLDDVKAPDFARSVDIHRKPGYDPVELFVDPELRFPMLKIGQRLIQKKLGMRMLMDVIPLDTSLVKGSHGRLASSADKGPLIITSSSQLLDGLSTYSSFAMAQVNTLLQTHFTS